MRGEFIELREKILLVGNSGTGKTHLAVALGIAACGQGKRVRFYQVTELIPQLMDAREERELTRLKKQLAKLNLLILNELGYVPGSKLGSELLFDVISTVYERFSLIVTTKLPFENWTEILGSERLTGSISSDKNCKAAMRSRSSRVSMGFLSMRSVVPESEISPQQTGLKWSVAG
ncbi:MAG: ATP-binding protein [Gimesia sp.]|nr:ATP-binding protein [Gimesia sp.]|tara:strand:- start:3983 stop:4510 length:528 start_codon:yes stop_codon:yes gene_type:complete